MRIKKLFRVVSIASVLSVSLLSASANASLFDDALTKLTGSSYASHTGSGGFATRTLDGYSFGSHRVRMRHQTYSLVSVDSPSISAGCSGIDMHLGGIAWLNAGQIQQMLETVAQGAGYVIFQLVMSALFSDLEAKIAKAVEFIQNAANFSIDSCAASTALASGAMFAAGKGLSAAGGEGDNAASKAASFIGNKMVSTSGDELSDSCKNLSSGLLGGVSSVSTKADSFLGAALDLCDSPRKAKAELDAAAKGSDFPQAFFNARENVVWNALTALGFGVNTNKSSMYSSAFKGSIMEEYLESKHYKALKDTLSLSGDSARANQLNAVIGTIVHSMVDTPVRGGYDDKNQLIEGETIPATLTSRQALAVLLCGHPGQVMQAGDLPEDATTRDRLFAEAANRCFAEYNQEKDDKATDITFKVCVSQDCSNRGVEGTSPDSRNLTTCTWGGGANPCSTEMFTDGDYLGPGFMGLFFTVAEELADAIENVQENEPLTELQKNLIIAAPFPLWQAINLAAVSPDIATNIVEGNSNMLAVMLAGSLLNDAANQMMARVSGTQMSPELGVAMTDIASQLRNMGDSNYRDLLRLYNTQNEIMTRVNTVNRAITMSSFASGITGADFAQAISY